MSKKGALAFVPFTVKTRGGNVRKSTARTKTKATWSKCTNEKFTS